MLHYNLERTESLIRKIAEETISSGLATTVPVIYANQNAPKPLTNYITINTLGIRPVGRAVTQPDPLFPDDVNIFQIVQDIAVTITFVAVGKKAISTMSRLELNMSGGNPTVLDRLINEAGVSPQGKGNYLDTTAFLETGYEPRMAMDIIFNAVQVEGNIDLGNIASVEISEIEYHTNDPLSDDDIVWTSSLIVPPVIP